MDIRTLPDTERQIYNRIKTLYTLEFDSVRVNNNTIRLLKIADLEEFLDEESPSLPSFEDLIFEVQELDRYLGKEVTDEVTIQAGKDVPYSWILKVTKTGEITGITKYNFVVIKTEG